MSRIQPWSLLVLSLLHVTRGDEKGSMSGSGGGGGGGMEVSSMHHPNSVDTPEQAYKKDMMMHQFESAHHHNMHTDMMKIGMMKKPTKLTSTRKGRGKKGDKKMQMMYLGLMYIKSVIQMVMMAIGQVLQFKSVIISLVSVLIQLGQFVLAVKKYLAQKQKMEVHLPPPNVEYHEKFPSPAGHPDDKYPYPPSHGWN